MNIYIYKYINIYIYICEGRCIVTPYPKISKHMYRSINSQSCCGMDILLRVLNIPFQTKPCPPVVVGRTASCEAGCGFARWPVVHPYWEGTVWLGTCWFTTPKGLPFAGQRGWQICASTWLTPLKAKTEEIWDEKDPLHFGGWAV